MVQMFFVVSNELILFKFVISQSILTYNRVSILTNDSLKSMGRFRIQLLLADNTWSTRINKLKNDGYSNTPTQWTKLSLNITV